MGSRKRGHCKLSNGEIGRMRSLYESTSMSLSALGRRYGVSESFVRNCIDRKRNFSFEVVECVYAPPNKMFVAGKFYRVENWVSEAKVIQTKCDLGHDRVLLRDEKDSGHRYSFIVGHAETVSGVETPLHAFFRLIPDYNPRHQ